MIYDISARDYQYTTNAVHKTLLNYFLVTNNTFADMTLLSNNQSILRIIGMERKADITCLVVVIYNIKM